MTRLVDEVFLECLISGAWLNKRKSAEYVPSVRRLGMSSLATCPRLLFLKIHNIFTIIGLPVTIEPFDESSRFSRLMDMGNLIEDSLVERLKTCNIPILDTQKTFIDLNGRLKGKLDGTLHGYPIEIKGLKSDKFQRVIKEGMLSVEPSYQYQLEMYIYYMKSTHGYFIVKNKDTEEFRVIRVNMNHERTWLLREKARNIIESTDILQVRIVRDHFAGACQYCPQSHICDKLPNSTIKSNQLTDFNGLYQPS